MNPQATKVVYTAVFGNYDRVTAVNPEWDCDFVCFTDNPEMVSPGWQIVICNLNGELPAQVSRRYKMLPHEYLSKYETSLYIDGNIKILIDPSPLFNKYLDSGIIAIPKHQDRNCAYIEAQLCINCGLTGKETTSKQMSKYTKDGFPKNFGMTENSIIFRKHNNKKVMGLMNAWWTEYCHGGKRDQLSLPYLIWKHKVDVLEVLEGPRIRRTFFEIDIHETEKSKSFIRQLAKQVTNRKHLAFHYLLFSKIIYFVVLTRDFIRVRSQNHN